MRSEVLTSAALSFDAEVGGKGGAANDPALDHAGLLAGGPAGLDLVSDRLAALAADPVDDSLEEGVASDRTGHQVRCVEADDAVRILQNLDALLQQRA